jgi:hypothetical protein
MRAFQGVLDQAADKLTRQETGTLLATTGFRVPLTAPAATHTLVGGSIATIRTAPTGARPRGERSVLDPLPQRPITGPTGARQAPSHRPARLWLLRCMGGSTAGLAAAFHNSSEGHRTLAAPGTPRALFQDAAAAVAE